jgi:hypothetical protein
MDALPQRSFLNSSPHYHGLMTASAQCPRLSVRQGWQMTASELTFFVMVAAGFIALAVASVAFLVL